MKNKTILICGGGGFIGHHLARSFLNDSYVIAVDLHENEFCKENTYCDKFLKLDLRSESSWKFIFNKFPDITEIYQLAADMGGAGYVFSGENDFNIMHNSALINIYCAEYAILNKCKVFYTSSACAYPAYNQKDPLNPNLAESSMYPAEPDSEYGWEKLFSERLYLSAQKNYNLNVKIARIHNCYGPESVYSGGREKFPCALSRKLSLAEDNGSIEIWGTGEQTRSFTYIDDTVDGIKRIMNSSLDEPINLGSDEMISIKDMTLMGIKLSNKNLSIKYIPGFVGVMGRNSDNTLIKQKLGWTPTTKLIDGLTKTYNWANEHIKQN